MGTKYLIKQIKNAMEKTKKNPVINVNNLSIRIGKNVLNENIWHNILVEWRNLMDAYAIMYNLNEPDALKKDIPYWYKEKANSGLLAGAIWRLGGSVVEEYGIERSYGSEKSKGRCDFLVCMNDLKLCIEAKICNPPSASDNLVNEIDKQVQYAKEQLLSMGKEETAERVALCFIVPELFNLSEISAHNTTQEIFDMAIQRFDSDNNIIARYLPPKGTKTEWERYRYPGVLLIADFSISREA